MSRSCYGRSTEVCRKAKKGKRKAGSVAATGQHRRPCSCWNGLGWKGRAYTMEASEWKSAFRPNAKWNKDVKGARQHRGDSEASVRHGLCWMSGASVLLCLYKDGEGCATLSTSHMGRFNLVARLAKGRSFHSFVIGLAEKKIATLPLPLSAKSRGSVTLLVFRTSAALSELILTGRVHLTLAARAPGNFLHLGCQPSTGSF